MKKLLITCTELMMIQFLVPHVKYLAENGFRVEIACSDVGGRMEEVRNALEGVVVAIHVLRLERSPVNPRNFLGYQDVRKLLKENRYDIIWTNEPVMGVVTRLAANKYRRRGTKVVYMCHGFHFFTGAGRANWLVYYPIERVMAYYCDAIITMNQEDFRRAQNFGVKKVYKIPGVGVDTARFHLQNAPEIRLSKRRQLGIPEDACVLLTVGELTRRKNQEVVFRALKELKDPSVRYILCGRGDRLEYLQNLAKELGIEKQIHFMGYRLDVPEFYRMADCFVFSSIHEGLPFALMEAMESGLPIVASRIRGNVDLIDDGVGGILCDVHSSEQFCQALQKIMSMNKEKMVQHNREKLKDFDLCRTRVLIAQTLNGILEG
ncbi:MAG: glycosyltransferase family 4 protein [Oscillospiraceae bacterium]|nr:glycosyltransferase family 4 protein [Oscillospiraceae bacterium]